MRDPKLESHLNDLGIPYQYLESVPLSRVNLKRSQENQARIAEKPLDADLVRQYRDAMKAGAKFPAAVVYEDGTEYIGVDGNHRFAAFDAAKVKTVDLYEVLTTPEDRVLLTYSLNTLNGRPQSEEDRDAHAVTLIHRGLTREVVAHTLNIPVRRVDEAVLLHKTHLRANQLGVKSPWSRIKVKHVRLELSRGEFADDSVFTEVVLLTEKYDLSRDQLRAIRRAIDAAPSEQARLSVLRLERKNLEAAKNAALGKRVGRKNSRGMYSAHLEYIIQHGTENLQEIWRSLTATERAEVRARLVAVGEAVQENLKFVDRASV